jgi:antitoxin MazE
MKVKIAKWGNSVGVRLPKKLADELGLAPGREVELGREGTRIAIETASERRIPRLRLEDLASEMKTLGAENEPPTIAWGSDRGSEIVDDAYSRGEITLDDILSGRDAARRR